MLQNSQAKPLQSKKSFLQSEFSGHGVVNRIIRLKLNFENAKSDSEQVAVTAQISMPFEYTDKLFFKWKLGENVVLASGQLTGEVNSVLKDEKKTITIFVTGFSKEINHHIGFEVSGIKNGKTIFADALIASDLENTFENTVRQVEKIKASK